MDFTAGEPTKKLTLTDNTVFAGNVAEKFEPTEPFSFVPKVPRDSWRHNQESDSRGDRESFTHFR
jgi:hypothetical protein